jgi:hypothetical protein
MYFTERIQNTLLRPEVMNMMKERSNSGNGDDKRRLSTNSESMLTKD